MPDYLRKRFISAPAFHGKTMKLALSNDYYENPLKYHVHIVYEVALFWIFLAVVILTMVVSLYQTLRDTNFVNTYLSICGPEDSVLNFDTTSGMKIPLSHYILDQKELMNNIAVTIEDKLSMKLIEKRQKYFKAKKIQFNKDTFAEKNRAILMSLAKLLYQLESYYKILDKNQWFWNRNNPNRHLAGHTEHESSLARYWNSKTAEEQKALDAQGAEWGRIERLPVAISDFIVNIFLPFDNLDNIDSTSTKENWVSYHKSTDTNNKVKHVDFRKQIMDEVRRIMDHEL